MKEIPLTALQFLSGGGEMGELIRKKDWSNTPVGNPETWTQSLRTTLSIILHSKFPMFIWWGKELLCFYNDAYRSILGTNGKHPSILGMHGHEAWPEIWEIIKPLIDQVLATGEGVWREDQLIPIYRNGKLEDVYWTFSYSPVNDESGKAAGVLVTCTETTEKVNNLKNIVESEERFRTMAESSDIMIAIADQTSNAIYFNKSYEDFTGRKIETLLQFGWTDLIHADDKENFVSSYLSAFEKRAHFSGEFRAMDKNGQYRFLSVKAVPRFEKSGVFIGYVSSCKDITESKQVEVALRESEERFRNVANNTPVLMWMSDTCKSRYFFNSEWLDFTGRKPEEESGNGWAEGVHPEDFDRCMNTYTSAFDKRETFYMEYRLKRHDNEYRWISDKGAPRFAVDGTFDGYIGACMDIHGSITAQKKIAENEERLNIVIDASELGTWEFNLKTRDIQYSDRYLQHFGYEKGTVLKHEQFLKHLHPDDFYIREKAFKEAYKSGMLHYESRFIWNDGAVHWMEIRGKLFYDSENIAERLIGTTRDITIEKLHEKELTESEQKFRLLADSMPQHIWTADTNGQLNYFNRSVYNYSGLSPEEIAQLGWLHIVHPEDKAENIRKWTEAVNTGADFLIEHRFLRHDGQYRWQLSRAIPQRDSMGAIQMWVGTSTDIQDQKMFANELEDKIQQRTKELKELNESLTKSEERYHLMVEEVQDYAILYLNKEGKVENWNKGAEKIKGYPASEIIGQSFSVFYTDHDRRNRLPQQLLEQASVMGRAVQEGWRVRKDGVNFWASVVITAVHNEANEVIGFSKVTHDLTEKKQAADALKNNAEQLRQKNTELEKMNKELESFAYISSHDLQEPLRKIQTFASRIVEKEYDSLSDSAKDNFQRMQGAAKRMQTLIEDLLAYSRTGNSEKKYVNSNLNEIVNEVKEDLEEELQQKNATVEILDMCHCPVIPFQFRQLMQNLLSNSLKFSKNDTAPHIVIKSETKKGKELNNSKLVDTIDYCHVSVSDNGIGFEPQYSEKIFEVFQRLHGKIEYIGTGIGLAIVKKIVDNHNGFITASGQVNEGATFDVYFPAQQNVKK